MTAAVVSDARGEFLRTPGASVTVHSRTGTRIPTDRISSEEYQDQAAIRPVLAAVRSLSRPELANEVRAVLGYGRSSAALVAGCQRALDAMLAVGGGGYG